MPGNGLKIRLLDADDLEAAEAHLSRHMAESGNGEPVFVPYEHAAATLPQWFDVERLARPIGTPGWQRWFAAFDNGSIVGHLDLKGDSMSTGTHRCTLGVGIERTYRSKGLGRQLMEAAIAFCHDTQGLDWLDLYVFAHNEPALALYKKLRFQEIGVVKDRFRMGGTSVDDVIMTLNVNRP